MCPRGGTKSLVAVGQGSITVNSPDLFQNFTLRQSLPKVARAGLEFEILQPQPSLLRGWDSTQAHHGQPRTIDYRHFSSLSEIISEV